MATITISGRKHPDPLLLFSVVALLGYFSIFFYLAIQHVLYPGPTVDMDGDAIQHIARITKGLPPYPMPEANFIAIAYMPLHYYVSAPFYLLFGDSFIGPRLVAAICAVLSGFLVILITWKESRSAAIASIAGAFYFAGFRIMDAWLTTAMPDSLMLLLLLAGYYFWAYGTRPWHDVLWLACFSLAFWTKQHGAFFFGVVFLYSLLLRGNLLPKWVIAAGFLLGGPISYFLLGGLFGDGFFYHTFQVPGAWETNIWFSVRRTVFILLFFVPFTSLLSFFYLRPAINLRSRQIAPLAWFTFGTFVSCCLTMMAAGSSNNHYIPLIAILSATGALGAQKLLAIDKMPSMKYVLPGLTIITFLTLHFGVRGFAGHPVPEFVPFIMLFTAVCYVVGQHARILKLPGGVFSALLLIISHLATSYYSPANYLPDRELASQLKKFQAMLANLDGPTVLVPQGYLPAALTKKRLTPAPSWVALDDVERQTDRENESYEMLTPFREYFGGLDKLYLISTSKDISQLPGWNTLADRFTLINDFGNEFSSLRIITAHWYDATKSFPRYLYEKKPQAGG